MSSIGECLDTMGIEKAFDSLKFILTVLKKIDFDKKIFSRVEVLLNNQESCLINGSKTVWYFPLLPGIWQGFPISAYVFLLC